MSTYALEEGRILIMNIRINQIEYCFVNVYAPNNCRDRILFYKELEIAINRYACSKTELILGGDFNCALNETDKVSKLLDSSTPKLKKIINTLDLHDAWKKLNSEKKEDLKSSANPALMPIPSILMSKWPCRLFYG